MLLLDTMVLSELRKRDRDPAVVAWLGQQPPDALHLSVISVGEIQRGIQLKRRSDAVFAARLQRWLDNLQSLYGERILPINTAIARRWGQLAADIGHPGADLMLAATALEHNMQVVTRNERHFLPTGVGLVNPFRPSPQVGGNLG